MQLRLGIIKSVHFLFFAGSMHLGLVSVTICSEQCCFRDFVILSADSENTSADKRLGKMSLKVMESLCKALRKTCMITQKHNVSDIFCYGKTVFCKNSLPGLTSMKKKH